MREVVKFHEFKESYQYREGLTNGYKPRLVNHDFRVSRVVVAAVLDMFVKLNGILTL